MQVANTKTKLELDWKPVFRSYREGIEAAASALW
jgi:hypothetical protein